MNTTILVVAFCFVIVGWWAVRRARAGESRLALQRQEFEAREKLLERRLENARRTIHRFHQFPPLREVGTAVLAAELVSRESRDASTVIVRTTPHRDGRPPDVQIWCSDNVPDVARALMEGTLAADRQRKGVSR